jgi:serine O-acetyltransferase
VRSTLDADGLLRYINGQIVNNFDDGENADIRLSDINKAMGRLEYCLKHVRLKYFYDDGPVFDHLHGDIYSMFLYFVSRELFVRGEERGATKVFLLNKMMFGIDLYFATIMPDIFYLSHGQGTVLGPARYSDYLVVYQGVCVGSDMGVNGSAGVYPSFGRGAVLLTNTTIVGSCSVGDNVTFGANSFLRNTNVSRDQMVVGRWPNNRLVVNKYKNEDFYFGK